MISNQLNHIEGIDPDMDALKKLGNRIKTLRTESGHLSYEKFAHQNQIGRMLLRRAETGANINYKTLVRIFRALKVTPAAFFSQGFD
jgi:transcriptional regulator with XRE-family HTH domain